MGAMIGLYKGVTCVKVQGSIGNIKMLKISYLMKPNLKLLSMLLYQLEAVLPYVTSSRTKLAFAKRFLSDEQ